jgi:hypothetical protein
MKIKKSIYNLIEQIISEKLSSILKEDTEKFRAEVTGIKEDKWSTNGKEFNTEAEAKKWLDNLSDRWFAYDMSRVVPSSTPKGQKLDMNKDTIYQNFRK